MALFAIPEATSYDLLPDTANRREHVLFFLMDFLPPDRSTIVRMADQGRIRRVDETIDRVVDAVSSWHSVFDAHDVPGEGVQRLAASISRRLKKLS